jgi:hypothetical protein
MCDASPLAIGLPPAIFPMIMANCTLLTIFITFREELIELRGA